MTNSTLRARARQRIHAIFTGRLPFVIVFGCILLVNWGAALWLIHYTYRERETAAYQMVSAEVQYSQQKSRTFSRTLTGRYWSCGPVTLPIQRILYWSIGIRSCSREGSR